MSRRCELCSSPWPVDGTRGEGGGRRRRQRRQPRAPSRAGRLLVGRAHVHVRRRRVLQLHRLLLPCHHHGADGPVELHARHDRRVLRDRRVPAPHAGCHGHRRRRRLGPVDPVAGGRQFERRGHRRPPGVPWITLPPDAKAVREVPALRDDGVPGLGPHGRFVPLQPLVPRLQVRR